MLVEVDQDTEERIRYYMLDGSHIVKDKDGRTVDQLEDDRGCHGQMTEFNAVLKDMIRFADKQGYSRD